MIKLEELEAGMRICGLVPEQVVMLIKVRGLGEPGSESYKAIVTYEDEIGELDKQTLRQGIEQRLYEAKDTWAIGEEAELGKLAWEARRIRDPHLFDPWHAVHTSDIEPLPHQIVAVYHEMLGRQPLRFLLADDPGAGKTIMAGLLIRELIAREDVRRCLICVPGKLQDQWERELREKFGLFFKIYAHEQNGNSFRDHDQMIVSIDRAKRSSAREMIAESDAWDLIICDEAHKMSATYSGGDISYTARYRLGQLLSQQTRHFLLMTATPHNGKDEDFRLFMRLLDRDRFAGRINGRRSSSASSDLYRRMMKEELRTFEGRPLFRERRAYTVDYELSWNERELYEDVTAYIRNEFDRARSLRGGRRTSVGFALTILQRRLASSPEAIYQSLKTRRRSLEERLEEWQTFLADLQRMRHDIEEVEDLSTSDREKQEDYAVRLATAALTPQELQREITILRELEVQANDVRHSDSDHKWKKLREIWQVRLPEMETSDGNTRKLIIFTEWRATIDYLVKKLGDLLGDPAAIVTIHGGKPMEQRHIIESRFRDDPRIQILVANDAAGEGINLQCAHLMVNYDLPWNPNRLEQRFGRIHRIGQKEVCHLWNLVSGETREGAVYKRLLEKIANEASALNGKVFDVLGELFQQVPLRDLLVDAVRYGDDPTRLEEFGKAVENATEQTRVRDLVQDRMLVTENIELSKLQTVMEESHTGRLQNYDTKEFLLRVFAFLNRDYARTTKIRKCDDGYFEIVSVPGVIIKAAEAKGIRNLRTEYPRICFERPLMGLVDRTGGAEFVDSRHPLIAASIAWVLERWQDIRPDCGDTFPVLIDESGNFSGIAACRVVYYVDWTLKNAFQLSNGERQALKREAFFVEIDKAGTTKVVGATPNLDYRPACAEELAQLHIHLQDEWLATENLDDLIEEYAAEKLLMPSRDAMESLEWERINRERSEVTRSLDSLIANERRQEAHFENLAEMYPDRRAVYNASRSQHEHRRMQFEARKMKRVQRWQLEEQISPSGMTVRRVAVIVPTGLMR